MKSGQDTKSTAAAGSLDPVVGPTVTPERLEALLRIAEAAHLLEEWMGRNSGTNDDWPIEIKADKDGADTLSTMLTELHQALVPYRFGRSSRPNENRDGVRYVKSGTTL